MTAQFQWWPWCQCHFHCNFHSFWNFHYIIYFSLCVLTWLFSWIVACKKTIKLHHKDTLKTIKSHYVELHTIKNRMFWKRLIDHVANSNWRHNCCEGKVPALVCEFIQVWVQWVPFFPSKHGCCMFAFRMGIYYFFYWHSSSVVLIPCVDFRIFDLINNFQKLCHAYALNQTWGTLQFEMWIQPLFIPVRPNCVNWAHLELNKNIQFVCSEDFKPQYDPGCSTHTRIWMGVNHQPADYTNRQGSIYLTTNTTRPTAFTKIETCHINFILRKI